MGIFVLFHKNPAGGKNTIQLFIWVPKSSTHAFGKRLYSVLVRETPEEKFPSPPWEQLSGWRVLPVKKSPPATSLLKYFTNSSSAQYQPLHCADSSIPFLPFFISLFTSHSFYLQQNWSTTIFVTLSKLLKLSVPQFSSVKWEYNNNNLMELLWGLN